MIRRVLFVALAALLSPVFLAGIVVSLALLVLAAGYRAAVEIMDYVTAVDE